MAISQVRPARKRRDRYHHGDLRRALLQAAVRTIHSHGVDGLTLRGVGNSLGVSRTALYRHFSDKGALLAAVAAEGFRMLRHELVEAWEKAGRGREGFEAQGLAYVTFAVQHPSHYRVMFGADIDDADNKELAEEGARAFQALLDAIIEQQRDGLIRTDEPLQMALYIWAAVHGIAMLAIDKRLDRPGADVDALTRYAVQRLRSGIAAGSLPS
jgi:AcrR family transcriptional regulator